MDQMGRTELHYASMEGDVEAVRDLLREKMSLNHQDDAGFTPLHFAAQQNATDVARVLLDSGANLEIENVHGGSPLFVAVASSRGSGEMIRLLRSRGADSYHANKIGQTPVDFARLIGNFDVAQFFDDLP